MAYWEVETSGAIRHLDDLHDMRMIDITLGRPPRQFLSDKWDDKKHVWIERGHHLKSLE